MAVCDLPKGLRPPAPLCRRASFLPNPSTEQDRQAGDLRLEPPKNAAKDFYGRPHRIIWQLGHGIISLFVSSAYRIKLCVGEVAKLDLGFQVGCHFEISLCLLRRETTPLPVMTSIRRGDRSFCALAHETIDRQKGPLSKSKGTSGGRKGPVPLSS